MNNTPTSPGGVPGYLRLPHRRKTTVWDVLVVVLSPCAFAITLAPHGDSYEVMWRQALALLRDLDGTGSAFKLAVWVLVYLSGWALSLFSLAVSQTRLWRLLSVTSVLCQVASMTVVHSDYYRKPDYIVMLVTSVPYAVLLSAYAVRSLRHS